MRRTCPHCAAVLPPVRDAYCSDCGNCIDEPPTDADSGSQGERGASSFGPATLFILVGVGAIVLAVFMAVIRRDWFEAVGTGGGGLVLTIVGLFWHKRATSAKRTSDVAISGTAQKARVVVSALCVSVLVAGVIYWHRQDAHRRAAVAGVRSKDEYRNAYFGFRVPIERGWQDVTEQARRHGGMLSDEKPANSAILLALARDASVDEMAGASLGLVAEALSAKDENITGADYLKSYLLQLQQRDDAPRAVTHEPQLNIAGVAFDRVSLRRPWGDGEIGMTIWVNTRRNHVISITGSYASESGRKAIEDLLGRVTNESEE